MGSCGFRTTGLSYLPLLPEQLRIVSLQYLDQFERQTRGVQYFILDGTAKGGAVFSIKDEVDIPVKFIGVGEQIDDMQPFDAAMFVEALMAEDGKNDDNTDD